MEKYTVNATNNTPFISFDFLNGSIEIKGRSIPENSVEFYRPLYTALDQYKSNFKSPINLTIHLEYYNSSSSACILNLLRKMEILKKEGFSIRVNWVYDEEDDDMLSAGKNYESITRLPFEMIKVEEN